jgi:serine/threonine protein kinase/Tfp pilus assembly protein PilF
LPSNEDLPVNAADIAIDPFVEAFERARAVERIANLRAFAPPVTHESHFDVLRELVRVDLEFGWSEGRPNSLGHYRDQYPEVFADPAEAREIAFEDYRLRRQAGQRPNLSEYRALGIDVSDWPKLQSEAFDSHSSRAASETPQGDGTLQSPHVALFRAVYARDSDAAERVAKAVQSWPEVGDVFCGFRLIGELGRGAFGRVYLGEQGDLANRPVALKVVRGLGRESQVLAQLQHTNIMPVYSRHSAPPFQAICMPYFGGATLADIVELLRARPKLPPSGAALVDPLRAHLSASAPRDVTVQNLERLSQLSYVDAVLLIAERLADGLAHAHEHGVLHRDIKPANVLLASDGQPMLLDFNLAAEMDARIDSRHVGGTLPYMPPEALVNLREGQRVDADARGDVYALGVVLWELLAGRHPFSLPTGSTRDDLNPMIAERQTPPGIRIVNPAVSPAWAAIVMRCLAPDPARRYQTARDLQEDLHRQRNDRPLRHTREPSWRERFAKWRRRHPRWAITIAAFALIAPLAAVAWDRQQRVLRADARESFAAFRDEKQRAWMLLNAPHAMPAERAEGLALAEHALSRFDAALHSSRFHRLDAQDQAVVRQGVAELAFATAGVVLKSPGSASAEEMQRVTDRAKSMPATELTQRYQPIAAELKAGRIRTATTLIRNALAETPSDPALWFLLADCHLLLGESAAALGCLDACLALYPNFYRTHYQRGIVRLELQQPEDARREFDAALALSPNFWPAYMQRAVARATLGDIDGAMADLDRVADLPEAPAQVEFMRARLLANAGDRAGASRAKAAGLARRPIDADDWVVRGIARMDDAPAAAMADFEQALKLDPHNRAALRNQANLLAESLSKPEQAVAVLDRLIEFTPDSGTDLAGRGVVLARLGRREAAHRDAAAALQADSKPFTQYQVAGIYALTARTHPADALDAVRFLALAFRRGVGLDLVDRDSDLDAIRQRPEFRRIEEAARSLREVSNPSRGKPIGN